MAMNSSILSSESFDFNLDTVTNALAIIHEEGFDSIYCSLTGVEIGKLSDVEIVECLRIELARDPFATPDDLVDDFATRHFIMSSRPAPSLRIFKDHNQLVRVLKTHSQGPAVLFAYLAGRLFFEAIQREKDIDSTTNRFARTQFLVDLHKRLAALPKGWHKSLTPEDEEFKLADTALRILSIATQEKPTAEAEGKSAQRAFEAMLRLDAIFNLRYSIYDHKLREDLTRFRDADDWSFYDLDVLLSRLEQDNIVRLQKKKPSHEGNAMILSAALGAINDQSVRFAHLEKTFELAVKKGVANAKVGHIFEELRKLGLKETTIDLSEETKRTATQLLGRMQHELSSESYSERKIKVLEHAMARAGNTKGATQIKRGVNVVKHLVEAGVKIDPQLKSAYDRAVKEKKISKASKPKSTQQSAGKQARKAMFANLMSGATFKTEE